MMASQDLINEGCNRAAELFGDEADKISFEDGRFYIPGTNYVVTLDDLAAQDSSRPFKAARTNEMHDPVFPNGAAACEVEIDPQTGAISLVRYATVDDVGRCINPMIVHGQTHGGIAQGVGQAMFESFYVEPDSGQPMSGSFMDYGMPRASTMPSFKTEIAEVISPTNPLGIKAGGEGGTTPALAVIVSAVVDALKEYGVTDIEMPTSPLTIWNAIQAGKKAKQLENA